MNAKKDRAWCLDCRAILLRAGGDDPCLLGDAAEGKTELVAFDRLNIKHSATYRTVRSGLLGRSAWLWLGELERRRMDCDSGSDSGNGGSRDRRHSANGLAPIPKGRKTQRLRSCQDSGAPCLARLRAWLGLPPSHSHNHWTRQDPLRAVRAGKASGPMSDSSTAKQRGSPIGRRPAPTVGWPSLRRVAPLWGKAVGKVV